MNVFLLAPALYAEGTESAAGNVAPWWLTLLIGIVLLAGGIVLYMSPKPQSSTEYSKDTSHKLNWREFGPVVIAACGLLAILRSTGVI